MTHWTTNDIPDQHGRIAVITGANSGLGYETSLALAAKGAQVIMTSRDPERGKAALNRIKQQLPAASLELMTLDLGSLASIRSFALEFRAKYSRLDLLINNAGVMAIPFRKTVDGFETQLGTNHLGHFALTGLLLDTILETPSSRIVNVSSGLHRSGYIHFDDLYLEKKYTPYAAYSQSKIANLYFTFELQRKLEALGSKTISVSAHPGYAATNLQGTSASSTGSKLNVFMYKLANTLVAQSQAKGALPQLYAATAPEVKGGEFFGPHFMGYRGYPKLEKAADKAYDKEIAAKLWKVSEELTGVKFSFVAQTV
ncbi:MAG: SDR family oxidoreductase [Chloroflexi bacterium]|uniref:Oxidoreductase n=1 Tax=Candidatus Chlorohelix allophototropha TaxID=3003348 RepID=A0A8T7M8Z6_9CHLR|nr:SDR family oxidoreductase [Chloroflexota bacterium]WJW68406.1 oxidoreductase [Chloroflexota bacterium L227-S17]